MIMNMSAGANIQPIVGKLLSTLNVGDTLEVPVVSDWQSRFGVNIVWKVADKNHTGYPANSVTLITEKIIQLMCFDAKEEDNNNEKRAQYGNNRYIYSNLFQWLNSDASAGNWYSAKHSADAPPTPINVGFGNDYNNLAGFINTLDSRFVTQLLETTLTVAKPSLDGGGYETFMAKMFNPSTTESGLGNLSGIEEGAILALFSNNDSRVAFPSAECVSSSEYSSSDFSIYNGWWWWLRTPNPSSYTVRYVMKDGASQSIYPYDGRYGVRPLCNLPGSFRVSETTNTSGHYTLLN